MDPCHLTLFLPRPLVFAQCRIGIHGFAMDNSDLRYFIWMRHGSPSFLSRALSSPPKQCLHHLALLSFHYLSLGPLVY